METVKYTSQGQTVAMSQTERDSLLQRWQESKTILDSAKACERELRDQIVAGAGLFDPNKTEGTQRVQLGNGWEIKAVKKIDYKLLNKDGETFAALEAIATLSESSARIAKSLCSFDAKLRKSEYIKLNADEKAILDNVLTTKPGAPSLELIPPK